MAKKDGASTLRLYNTLTKREEEFRPINAKKVGMYTCGPTVYGRPHIGNYSSFLMADLLRRWLEVLGYEVRHVKNITDVGHLVADRDEGEDKVEKQAKEEQVDPLVIARKYTEQYLADEKMLNMLEPYARPRATETIKEMIEIIQVLLKKGHAYETEDGIYFSVETFPAYGALSGNTLKNLSAGARVEVDEMKKHPADFALWKKCVGANSMHLLRWSYPAGERTSTMGKDEHAGFPGWHIECSAMSRKFLGEQIDIHTGGEDNIFPHHECEIAQSESGSGKKPFVHTWVHRRRINLGEEKMSKSLGNVFTLSDILDKGYGAQDLRYYLLSVHYRTNLKFTWKGLDDAKKARRKIVEWMEEVRRMKSAEGKEGKDGEEGKEWGEKFFAAMNADLNTPAALAVLFDAAAWSRNVKQWSQEGLAALQSFTETACATFGCFESGEEEGIPSEVQELLDARAAARAKKDFAESDRLRGEIEKIGYEVKDGAAGQKVRKI